MWSEVEVIVLRLDSVDVVRALLWCEVSEDCRNAFCKLQINPVDRPVFV